jgi:hypothetical protein
LLFKKLFYNIQVRQSLAKENAMKLVIALTLALIGIISAEAPYMPGYSTATVYLSSNGTQCASVHVGDGMLITAAHCVKERGPIFAYLDDDYREVVLVGMNAKYDFALLRVDQKYTYNINFWHIANYKETTQGFSLGDSVFILSTFERLLGGHIKEIYPEYDTEYETYTDIQSVPGMSGSPVLNRDDMLVGFVLGLVENTGTREKGMRFTKLNKSIFVELTSTENGFVRYNSTIQWDMRSEFRNGVYLRAYSYFKAN